MIEQAVYLILISQIVFWGVIFIIGGLLVKQLKNTDPEEELPTMDQVLSGVLDIFSKDVSKQIKTEFHSKETQTMLTNTSIKAIASLMAKEENQDLVAEFLMQSFASVLEEVVPQIMQTTTGIQPTTPAEAKKIDEKATNALGALTVNAAAELLPPGAGLVLDRVFPDWKEQAQANPREFMAMMAKAKEWGIFNMLEGITSSLSPSTTNTRTPRQSKVF